MGFEPFEMRTKEKLPAQKTGVRYETADCKIFGFAEDSPSRALRDGEGKFTRRFHIKGTHAFAERFEFYKIVILITEKLCKIEQCTLGGRHVRLAKRMRLLVQTSGCPPPQVNAASQSLKLNLKGETE
jgi:hypothetical protein